MELLIETVLRNALTTRKDLFGEDSIFVRFEEQDAHSSQHQFCGIQSSLLFGRIVYHSPRYCDQKETEHYSSDLILKKTPTCVPMKYFTMLQFFNETFFYTKMLSFFQTFDEREGHEGNVRALFPQYYNSLLQYEVNADQAVIVLENLRSYGYVPAAKKSFLDYDHLSLMMRKLGRFHAYSYRARNRRPDEFRAMIRCQLESNGLYLIYYPRIQRGQTRGLQPLTSDPRYSSRCENVRRLFAECDQVYRKSLSGDENNRTHVVCHGDFIGNNVLFAYENGKPIDLKMLDLGTWRYASPAFDLAMVLYMNADQSMRDENWDKLLDEYYASLRNTFPTTMDVPTKDSILDEFKAETVMGVYFLASFFLTQIVASDNRGDVPEQADLCPPEYKDVLFALLPPDLLDLVLEKQGGDKATVALSDVLKDMIDRGFV